MTTSKRDKRVTIERFTATADEYNQPIQTWATLDTRWTAVYYGTGTERRTAATEQGQQAASFVMLLDSTTSTVTIEDRLSWLGSTWDILGITRMDDVGEIEFTASRKL